MAFRQRTPSFRPQLSMRRVYETMQPQSETNESPEAYIIRVYLPGFPRDSVKTTYEAPSRTMRITGERQIQGTRWVRFDQSYPVPDYCEPEAVKGRFETPILTLTLPKKTSQDTPKQQVETAQEKGVVAETKPDQKGQDTIPPQPTITTTKVEDPIEDKKSGSPPRQEKATLEDTPSQIPSQPIKPQRGKEETVERLSSAVTSMPQMSEKELEPKPTPTRATTMQKDEKLQTGKEEVESKSTPTMLRKIKTAEKPQNVQEDVESKSTPTMLTKVKTAERPEKGQEEFEPKPTTMAPKIKTDEEPPKGEDEVEPKHATTNVTRKPTVKEQLEEKKTEGTSAEDLEERMPNKEVIGEPSESRKLMKHKEQSDSEEEETKKKGPFVPKKKKEGKSEENAMEWFGSVSQTVSKIAEGIMNEEEKKLAANIGAAFLIIAALGAYVSYRFAS